ncbi:MAG: dihydrodipicolinate reductase [Spirochaetaceae bacterium]|jgi:4-hydroxy-tetrahydrodipicolinate reductase|nr:dihydrodipicolinate reductase [Spirochaetaceae bacterium]
MENVKVIIWGLGAMGSGIAELLLSKKGVDIVGVVGRGDKIGKSVYDFLSIKRGSRPDLRIGGELDVITEKAADVVILCTDSFTARAFEKIKFILEKKINVITSAEEMAYPAAQEPELAKKLDEIAKQNGVTVLGTGINPGLIMDLLVIIMTGCCYDVDHIAARRVNSLSPFGPAVMEEQGIGITAEAFKAGVKSGKLSGHVGFAESIRMIGDAIGWKVEKITQSMEPIITKVDRKSPHGFAKAGNVAGCAMKGQGYVDGKVKIDMDHPQQIEPELAGVKTGDYVTIKGTPDINLANMPEVPGGIGTIAMCVNMIPHVINARPGLKTMIDLPVPRVIMGDMRDLICEEAKIVTGACTGGHCKSGGCK